VKVSGPVSVASTGEGRQVLATWSSGAVYVLDARTGERVGHWSTAGRETHILDPALPVVARTGPDGRTTIARVGTDGRDVWTYALQRCQGARATLSGTVVVVTPVPHCAGASDRLVALDAATGGRLWVANVAGDVRAVVPVTAFVLRQEGTEGATGSLSAISLADGALRWTTDLPRHARGMPCEDHQVQASAQVALVICTWDLTDYPMGVEEYASTVYTYDAASGRSLGSVTYGPAPVVSSAVLANGTVVVARADLSEGWTLDVVSPSPRTASLRVGSYWGGHLATVRGLIAFDNQVLVVDSGAESLRSIR
jgi:outer membrane protein assembly factor BamB